MNQMHRTVEDLIQEKGALQARLEAAEETLRAIQSGEVDALVIYDEDGEKIYTVEGADYSYRVMVENISEGVANILDDGMILYCNRRLADMLGRPLESLIGSNLQHFIRPEDQPIFHGLLRKAEIGHGTVETTLKVENGSSLPALLSLSRIENKGQLMLCLVVTDLTEQKRSEEVVAAERLGRSILEQASDAILVCDTRGTVIRANRSALTLSFENPLFHPFEDSFRFLDRAESQPAAFSMQAALNGSIYQGVEVWMDAPGSPLGEPACKRCLLLSTNPLLDDHGKMVGCILSLTDITENKRTEETLRKVQADLAADLADAIQLQKFSTQIIQEDQPHALYDHLVRAAMALMDSDMGSMQVLDPAQNVLGLVASPGFDPESGRFWERVWAGSTSTCGVALSRGERVVVPDIEACDWLSGTGDLVQYRSEGIRAVQSTPLLTRSGRIVGMLSTHWREPHQPSERDLHLLDVLARQAADLVERAQAEAALRDSHDRLLLTTEAAEIGVWEWDIVADIFTWDDRCWPLFDVPVGARLTYPVFIQAVHPEDRLGLDESIQIALESQAIFKAEYRTLWPDHSVRWVYTRGQAVYDEDGHPTKMVGVMMDITDRKVIEEEIRSSQSRIEAQHRLIEQREQERQQISRDLHDGPVQALIAITFSLHSLRQENISPEISRQLESIQTSLQEQINELRAYAGELRPPILGKFGLGKSIQSHLDTFRKKNPELDVQYLGSSSSPLMPDDKRLALFRIYQEAMSNIVRHARATQALVQLDVTEDQVVLEIQDNGAGFDLPGDWLVLARKGHLGLVGMRERAEAVGGTVTIHSRPGSGTLLQVRVPLHLQTPTD